jgi:hypothetical protein
MDGNNTQVSGSTATHNSSIGLLGDGANGKVATLHTDPFIDFSVEIVVHILDGKLDLSGGFTAEPKFFNDLSRAAQAPPPMPSGGYGGGDEGSNDGNGTGGGHVICARGISIALSSGSKSLRS